MRALPLLAPLGACTPLASFELEVAPGVATVARARWSLGVDAPSRVTWGVLPDCATWGTPWREGPGPHEEDLLGGRPGEAVCARVEVDLPGAPGDPPRTVVLGRPPPGLAAFQVEDLGLEGPAWLLGSTGGDAATMFLLDEAGELLWYRGPEPGRSTPSTQALDPVGGLAFLDEPTRPTAQDARIEALGWGGEGRWSVDAPTAHHGFEVLPDGTIGWLAWEVREVEGWGDVVGDVVMERSPDGEERVAWSAWDTFPLQPDPTLGSDYYPGAADWTHADHLWWDPDRDTWTVSMRNIDTVAEIDRATGTLLRSVGRYATHPLVLDDPALPEDLVDNPHGARWRDPDHLVLLVTPDSTGESLGIELELDDAEGTSRVTWTWGQGLGRSAMALGQVLPLPGGDRLVAFGTAGVVERVDPDGRVRWRMTGQDGAYPAYLSDATDLLEPLRLP